mgnify:CR=1 FL=1
MVTCGVERFFDIAKGLPPNRGSPAAALPRAASTPSEVLPRDSEGARDRDLFTDLTAMMMSIIPPIVAMVCSTDIHPIKAPDGCEVTRGLCGSRGGAVRMNFEKRTWKLTVPSTRVDVTSAERKPR